MSRVRAVMEDSAPTVTLLCTAAFHLAAANAGRRLYARARTAGHDRLFTELNEDPTTVETAATVLVTSSCVSAIDMCCGAVARFAGLVTGPLDPGTREGDFGIWRLDKRVPAKRAAKLQETRAALKRDAPSLDGWLAALESSETWLDLDELRQGVVHKWWRRDITIFAQPVVGGADSRPPRPFAETKINIHLKRAGSVELDTALPTFYDLAEAQWRACVQAFEHVEAPESGAD